MRYIRVRWNHAFPDEPVDLYYELDREGENQRTVEAWLDGRLGFADAARAGGGTRLSVEPIADLQAIAADPQFDPAEISRAEFESVWSAAVQSSSVRRAETTAGRA